MRWLKKRFFQFLFLLFGWRTKGRMPDVKKFVLIVAPHTSNYDFFVGLAARYILDLRSHFLAKNSLFKIPVVGWFFKIVGGIPVDRSRNTNIVDQVVELFDKRDRFVLTVAPEGTRSYRPIWRTGFYRIAEKANVPIVMVAFDYSKKLVEVNDPFIPTGNLEEDIEMMKSYYRTIVGKNPELGIR